MKEQLAQTAVESGDLLEKMFENIVTNFTEYGFKIIGGILILIIGKIVAGFCSRIVRNVMTRAKVDPAVAGFTAQLVKYAVLVFAVVAALSKFGIEATQFIAVMAAAGLAVGLALQGSLSNFASGFLLLIFQPFKAGDLVTVAGSTGIVREIGIFTTTLNSPDNKRIIVPNSSVTGDTIINLTTNDTRRVDLTAGISYGDDMREAKQVLMNMLKNHPKVLDDPAPTVEVVELADSSVNLVVRPWCRPEDYWDVYFGVTQAIKESLDAAGISIPFPQQDVHLDNME